MGLPEFFHLVRLSTVKVDRCGGEIVSPPWQPPRQRGLAHVLLLGVRGTVPLQTGALPVDLVPRRMVLVPSGTEWGGRVSLAAPAKYYWAEFRGVLRPWEGLEEEAGPSSEGAVLPRTADLGSPEAERLFLELLAAARPPASDWKQRIRFLELLVHLSERSPVGPGEAAWPRLATRAKERVTEEIDDPNLSVKSLAHAEGVNADYLSRLFKRAAGVSLGEFIARQRVEKAKTLLTASFWSNAQVARACGFGSDRQFLRVFKQWVGESPGEHRRRLGGAN